MQKIIVTGGAGFIGRHLAKSLLEKNYEVHVIDFLMDEFTGEKISNDILLKYFDDNFIKNNIHKIDILDYEKISPIFNNAYGVIHLAAFISSPNSINNPLKAFDTNIKGTLHVLESARNNGCNNVILTSSGAVYGSIDGLKNENDATHPENPYGLSKFIDEQLGKLYNDLYKINVTCVRYSNVWGPDQHDSGSYAPAIGRFIKEAKNNSPMPICGDGEQTRDFIHVYDVVKANTKILENIDKEKVRGEVFNVCSGIESKVIDIANLVANIIREKNNANAEIIHIAPRIEPRRFVGDNTKIKNALGWNPIVTLEEGIREII
ncbi:MAG: GDP-mannose 4,6-dehydratase [Candidatus Nomurabacteria bacterium]